MKSPNNYICPRCGRPHMLGTTSLEGSYGIDRKEFDSRCFACGLLLHIVATPAKRSFLFGLVKLNDSFYESVICYHVIKGNSVKCLKCDSPIPPNMCAWDESKSGYQPFTRIFKCDCGGRFKITHYDSNKKYKYDTAHISQLIEDNA